MRKALVGLFLVACAKPSPAATTKPPATVVDYGPLPQDFAMGMPESPEACAAPRCGVARTPEEARALGIPAEALVDFSRFMLVRVTVRAEPRDGVEGRGPWPIAYYADEDPGHVAHVPGGCYSPAGGAWHGPSAVVLRMPRADVPVKFVDTSPCDPRAP